MSTDNLQSFSHFISRYLPGKIQKISVNAGSTCPNRDGSKGTGGCIYCNNASFSPAYTAKCRDIVAQIEEGKRFFSRKYPDMRYLAYFQSYTSTNAPVSDVIGMIDQAMAIEKVEGVIIGTRPDCMPDELLMQLKERAAGHFVMIEYGAESANNKTLDLINRCHSWEETADAVRRTADAGIPVGLHIILGLPGETREDMMQTIDSINRLPVDVIKCHQLQIIAGTRLAKEIGEKKWHIEDFTPESYADLCCDILERLRPGIAVERFVSQAPDGLLIHPRWGLKNYQFMDLLRKKINERR
jgi:hypothetical protein